MYEPDTKAAEPSDGANRVRFRVSSGDTIEASRCTLLNDVRLANIASSATFYKWDSRGKAQAIDVPESKTHYEQEIAINNASTNSPTG